MLIYNTQLKKLLLPEYGRNIQQMVDHCITIENRDERTKCAYSIINTMGNIFPNLRDDEEFRHKLWDHLVIMSDFKLDIDFPYDVISAENLQTTPQMLSHNTVPITYRHYGKYLQLMIEKLVSLEDGDEKEALSLMIANHMKKMLLTVNCDVDDARVFNDLYNLSNGNIKLDAENCHLHQFKENSCQQNNSKKKKKK